MIYVVRDQVSAEEDLKLARHILEIHTTSDFAEEPPIDVHLLKKYIAYSKRLSPILTPEAKEKLEEYYLRLRRTTAENQIPATPRSLESLIRLATARARLMHREQVLREDADAAMRLMDLMLETVLVDASTGRKGDFGAILGLPASQVNRLSRALDVFKALETSSQSRSVQSDVFNAELQKALGIDEAEARKVAGVLEREGEDLAAAAGHLPKYRLKCFPHFNWVTVGVMLLGNRWGKQHHLHLVRLLGYLMG